MKVIQEEIIDDNEVLPLWEGKIMAQVKLNYVNVKKNVKIFLGIWAKANYEITTISVQMVYSCCKI